MKRRNKVIGAALCALAVFVILASRGCGEKVPEVEAVRVCRGEIVESSPAGGKIRPMTEVEIAAEVSGEIVFLPISEGDAVKKGQVLLKIRQDSYLAALESAQASLGMLRAEYEQQRLKAEEAAVELERAKSLCEKEAAPQSRLESAQASKRIADSQLEAAGYAVQRGEAALREAEDNLSRTVITSPMDGTVTLLAVKKGERIVGTSQMAGTLIMRIADLSEMELIVNVGENDVVRIHEGDSAGITVDAFGKGNFKGRVTKIANSAKFVDGTFGQVTNFEVRIAMLADSADGGAFVPKPGMSASASIRSASERDILKVPAGAVFLKERRERLWVVKEGKVHSVKIETGLQDLDFVGILGGVKEGEMVVTAPASAISGGLSEGMKVKVRNSE